MSCSIRHNITVTNITNDKATVPYPLLLIKGHITNPCAARHIKASTQPPASFNGTFAISTAHKHFKCLISLTNGPNSVTLTYCNTAKAISVTCTETVSLNHQHFLKVIYVICTGHDGRFQSPFAQNTADDACVKIDLAMQLVQCVYGEKLQEHGFGRKSFRLVPDGCEPFYSELTLCEARQMNEQQLWYRIGRELVASKWGTERQWKFVAFLGCTRFEGIADGNSYTHENVQRRTSANAALGGGDLALFGTGCLYTWPSRLDEVIAGFQNERHVDVTRFMDDSNNRRTFGGCFATTLGSLCHEIGHVFGLGHTATGIMGNGLDFVNRVFTVDNLTENLPQRIVTEVAERSTMERRQMDARLTNMRRSNNFLLNYQEQKGDNDATFFAENSAIVLSHHKWLNDFEPTISNVISYEFDERSVRSQCVPLRLVELRQQLTALAIQYFVVQGCLCFRIPDDVDVSACDLFVMDERGNCELFPGK